MMKEKIIKALLAAGLASSVAVGGFFLTAKSEAPNGIPILSSYLDTGNIPTICLGSTRDINGVPMKLGVNMTEDQCVDLFVRDYMLHYNQMKAQYRGEFVSGWQEAAITDFVYHKGVGAFRYSTLLKRLQEGRHDEACDQLMRWVYGKNKQGKKVVINGLVNRASEEFKWCMGEVPSEIKYIKDAIDRGEFKYGG